MFNNRKKEKHETNYNRLLDLMLFGTIAIIFTLFKASGIIIAQATEILSQATQLAQVLVQNNLFL